MRRFLPICAVIFATALPGAAFAQQATPSSQGVPPPPSAAPLPPQPPQQQGAAAPAVAQVAAAAGGNRANASTVQRINDYFNSFKTMVGDFVQIDPDGNRRQGEFAILKPGRVLFRYAAPSRIELVADGRSVAVVDKKLKTQDITPLSATPLRFLLSENFDLARNGNVTGVYLDDVFATVVLEEKQPMAGTFKLMIMFDAKTMQLKQWTVTDPQGYDTTVAVSNLDTSYKPDPMLFVINRN